MSADKLVWLASYPRCGSNWLRILLNQIMASPRDAAVTIPSFKNQLPRSVVPRYKCGDDLLVFLKTHNAPDTKRMERVDIACAGQITIFRHPLDIVLSSLNFARIRSQGVQFKDNEIKSVDEIISSGEID